MSDTYMNVIYEGTSHGLPIQIKEFGKHGRYWQCGYVRLPARHPWRELDLQFVHNDVVPVRGGITYGPTTDGWIGFDTDHLNDTWPQSDPTPMEDLPYTKDGTMTWFQDLAGVMLQRGAGDDPVTWTPELMRAETERLAALAVQATPESEVRS